MFELDESLTYVDAPPERVIAIITSLNTPDVMTDLPKPEPTQAFITTVAEPDGSWQMYIYLYHQKSNVARIYPWRREPITRDNFADVEAAALEFTESMGFLMDNSNYRKKPAQEREEFYNSIPVFMSDVSDYARQLAQKDDPSLLDIDEDIVELDIEGEGGGDEEIEMVDVEEAEPYEAAEEIETVEELESVETFEAEPLEVGEAGEITGEVQELTGADLGIDLEDPFSGTAEGKAPAPEVRDSDLAETLAGLGEEEGLREEAPAEGLPFDEISSDLDNMFDEGGADAEPEFVEAQPADEALDLELEDDEIAEAEAEAAAVSPAPEESFDLDLSEVEEGEVPAFDGAPGGTADVEPTPEPASPAAVGAAAVPVATPPAAADLSLTRGEPGAGAEPPAPEVATLKKPTESTKGKGSPEEKPTPERAISERIASAAQPAATSPAAAAAAGSSLEEELLGEEPRKEPQRLSETVIRERLSRVGRVLAAW